MTKAVDFIKKKNYIFKKIKKMKNVTIAGLSKTTNYQTNVKVEIQSLTVDVDGQVDSITLATASPVNKLNTYTGKKLKNSGA